jgi:hypothetical protein
MGFVFVGCPRIARCSLRTTFRALCPIAGSPYALIRVPNSKPLVSAEPEGFQLRAERRRFCGQAWWLSEAGQAKAHNQNLPQNVENHFSRHPSAVNFQCFCHSMLPTHVDAVTVLQEVSTSFISIHGTSSSTKETIIYSSQVPSSFCCSGFSSSSAPLQCLSITGTASRTRS